MEGRNPLHQRCNSTNGVVILLAALLGLLAAASLPAVTAAADDDPVPDRVPVGVRPLDFSFSACANGDADRSQERTFVITNTDTRPVQVTYVLLESGVPDDWLGQGSRAGNQGLRGGPLQPGASLHFSVVFRPQAVRDSTAVLRFDVEYPVGGGTVQEQVRIDLTGEGRDCAPPPGGQDGQAGGSSGSDGSGDGDAGQGGDGQVGEDGEGGPAQPEVEVCVTFHIVTSQQPDPEPTGRDADRWLEEANRAFAGSGVEFRRDKPIDRVREAGEGEDPHCLDVYLVDDIPGATAGRTSVSIPRTRGWSSMVDGLGLPENVADLMGYGTSITMESGGGAAQTLAHELGHALGLGVTPPGQDTHLDPETGSPITDRGRLMHPSSNGNDVTDREKEIARRVAEYLTGTFVRCDQAFHVIPGGSNASPKPPGDLVYASIAGLDDRLLVTVRTAAPLAVGETGAVYTVEFDTDLDGQADQRVSFQHSQGEWFGEPLLGVPDPPTIAPPGYLVSRAQGAPGSVEGLFLSIPRDALPQSFGKVGWRVALQVPELGSRDVLPGEGFAAFDITPPDIMVALDDASRDLVARPGETVPLKGEALPSSTFTGDLEFSAALASAQGTRKFALGTLPRPASGDWEFELALPEDLEAGEYALTVEARCDLCRRATSLNARLQVAEPPATPTTSPTATPTPTPDPAPARGSCNGRGGSIDLGFGMLLAGMAAVGLAARRRKFAPHAERRGG